MVRKLGKGEDTYTEKQNIMREPFMDEFSEHLQRLRRNLLVTGSACIVYKISGVTLSADGSFLGVKYAGLKTSAIEWVLIVVVAYLLVHFLWAAAEHFHKWRLRLSGTRDSIEDWKGGDTPYPEDVSQYTLYNWWLSEGNRLKTDNEALNQLIASRSELETANNSTQETIEKLLEQNIQIIALNGSMRDAINRFDGKFWNYQKSRILRFFFIEYGMPIIAGGVGMEMLLWGVK